MVYLQGMSHEFQVNVINAFYNKFWNQISKIQILKFCFWQLKKNGGYKFLIRYFFSD